MKDFGTLGDARKSLITSFSSSLSRFGLGIGVIAGLSAALLLPFPTPATERNWLVIPILMVNPENGIGAGAKYVHRASSESSNEWDLHFYLTTKHQWELKVERLWGGFFEDAAALRSEAHFFYYPESYFGLGNDPLEVDELVYQPLGMSLEESWEHDLWQSLRVKASGYVSLLEIRGWRGLPPDRPDDFWENHPIRMRAGSGGMENDLWSLSVEWDSRDEEKAATRGVYAGQKIGHSLIFDFFSYGWYETWVAAYTSFGGGFEAAGKIFQQSVTGSAPFTELPYLGDKRLMRGVTRKRLRDRSAQALQTELRYQFDVPLPDLINTWQIAVFAESGRVGNDIAEASRGELHFSGGVGGRVVLGRRLAVLRGDLGFSKWGPGIYIDFGQAF